MTLIAKRVLRNRLNLVTMMFVVVVLGWTSVMLLNGAADGRRLTTVTRWSCLSMGRVPPRCGVIERLMMTNRLGAFVQLEVRMNDLVLGRNSHRWGMGVLLVKRPAMRPLI